MFFRKILWTVAFIKLCVDGPSEPRVTDISIACQLLRLGLQQPWRSAGASAKACGASPRRKLGVPVSAGEPCDVRPLAKCLLYNLCFCFSSAYFPSMPFNGSCIVQPTSLAVCAKLNSLAADGWLKWLAGLGMFPPGALWILDEVVVQKSVERQRLQPGFLFSSRVVFSTSEIVFYQGMHLGRFQK